MIDNYVKWRRFLFATTSGVSLICASAAAAQERDDEAVAAGQPDGVATSTVSEEPGEALETTDQSEGGAIVVTGTRIRGIAPTGSNVIGLNASDIRETGLSTTTELLRSMPQVSNIGVDESRTNGAQRAVANLTAASSINLRGLGPDATLTLLNGRRPTIGGGEGRFFDTNAIPAIALERIEVVADGSSAIYGSDAMTGVANLITRRSFDGVEVRSRYGFAEGGVDLYQVEGIGGLNWEGGNLVVAGEYYKRDNLPTAERPFLYNDAAAGSFQASPPNFGPSGAPTSGFVDVNGNGELDPGEGTGRPVVRQSNWLGVDALPTQERKSFFAHVEQDIGVGASVFVDGFFARRDIARNMTAPIFSAQTVSAANPFNNTGAPVTVNYSFINDFGNDRQTAWSEVWQVIGGGEFRIDDNWRISGSASYGVDTNSRDRFTVNAGGLAAALGSANPDTAFNPFSDGTTGPQSASVRQAVLDTIIQTENTFGEIRQSNAQLQIDGSLFELPGGAVRLAAGGEYQGVERRSQISISRAAGVAPPDVVVPLVGRRVFSAFGELFVPVVGPDNASPGLQSLELSLAGRYDHYLDRQYAPDAELLRQGTFNPKVGLRYEPIEDLMLRASWGKSFRAPVLSDYSFGAPTRIQPAVVSPAVAAANGLPLLGSYNSVLVQGGRPGLVPEEAETWTAGFEWQPEWISGLQLSATYYNIRFNNQLTQPASASSLTDPNYVAALTSVAGSLDPAGLVVFNPTTEQVANFYNFGGALTPRVGPPLATLYGTGSAPGPGQTSPVYVLIEGLTQNSGTLKTDGFDVSASYAFDTELGAFTIADYFTYVLNYNQSLLPGAPLRDFLNTVNFPLRFVNRTQLGWSDDGVAINVFVNYQNSYRNETVTPAARVEDHVTVDFNLSYNTGDSLSMPLLNDVGLALIVQNLLDADPPYARTVQGVAVQNYDSQNASALGRLVSFQVSKRF